MALVPRIDQSCPLGVEEQRRIAGHCDHCDTPVHALDGLDDVARRALLGNAERPICVSYRAPARLAQMAAIAITLVATSAFAGEPAAASPASSAPAGTQAADGTVTTKQERVRQLGTLIVMGAVRDPSDAAWVDDSTLPELPVAADADAPMDSSAKPDAASASN